MHGGHPKILWPNAPKQWRDRCSGADGAWTRSREVMAMTTTEKLPHLIPVSRSILLGIENGVKRFLRLESVSSPSPGCATGKVKQRELAICDLSLLSLTPRSGARYLLCAVLTAYAVGHDLSPCGLGKSRNCK